MSREINEIKDAAGAYRKWALEARKQYINLRLRQDPEIRALYIRSADRVARELRQLAVKTPSGRLRKRQLEQLEADLRAEAEKLTGNSPGPLRSISSKLWTPAEVTARLSPWISSRKLG